MKQKCTFIFTTLVLVLGVCGSAQLNAADKTAVVQVVAIDTHGNTAAYLKGLTAVLARNKELAPKSDFHVYQAGFSGNTTGMIYIVIDYPSMTYLAEVGDKVTSDPEWKKGVEELEKTGRTIESDSILFDVTP